MLGQLYNIPAGYSCKLQCIKPNGEKKKKGKEKKGTHKKSREIGYGYEWGISKGVQCIEITSSCSMLPVIENNRDETVKKWMKK